jgi:hypothetical protein
MNEFSGYAIHKRGGWWAMTRFARDAKPKPILGEGGAPIVFTDELSATKGALQHVLAYFSGKLVCSGEIKGGTIKQARIDRANRLFLGGGRTVQVERKEARV